MNTNARKIETAANNVAKLAHPTLAQIMATVKPVPEFVTIKEGPRMVGGKFVKVTGTLVFNWKNLPSEQFPTLADARKAKEAYEIQNAAAKACWELLYRDSAYAMAHSTMVREYYSTLDSRTNALVNITKNEAVRDLSRI